MRLKTVVSCAMILGLALSAEDMLAQQGGGQQQQFRGGDESWSPKRVNKVIELWEMGQPVYYTQISGGGYEEGLRLAQTSADYITYNWEHAYVHIPELREFMRGLVDGGPTRSGHRTPAVVVVTPAWAWNETAAHANAWLAGQIMNAGVHGLLIPHAVDVEAVRVLVSAVRYPFAPPLPGIAQGKQGNGSAGFAAQIWGLSQNDFLQKADVWPANPNGEIILGLKIENIHAVENVEYLVSVPGIAFAEWGPGDQTYWLGARQGLGRPAPGQNSEEALALRARVLKATKDAGVMFLNSCGANDVIQQIQDGVMICTGGDTQAAQIGREYTNRRMPW